MRVLFDHNVPHKLRRHLPGHEVVTAEEMGWAELVNGQLLRIAEESGFAVMLTADQNIPYQQNLSVRALALVILSTNDWNVIRRHTALVEQALLSAAPGSLQQISLTDGDL